MNDTVCKWTYDEYNCWETECGGTWWFDSSLEYGCVRFCPGCGKRISVAEEQK